MMWQTQTTIEYPFALRPASIEEAGLFYSQMDEAEDAVLGTVGHTQKYLDTIREELQYWNTSRTGTWTSAAGF